MGTRQYIGARYVPKFADPIEWDNARSYEALTIVTYYGTSYTSKKEVPTGVEITNSEYWVATGNYNAQIEEYVEVVNGIKNDGIAIATLFGVDNTGVANAGAQINTLFANHKSIFLPAGEYNIETAIEFPSNSMLIGEPGTVLIHNVQENPGVFTVSESNNVRIEGLTIKGIVATDSDNNVSTIYKSNNVYLKNVRYIDLRGIALIVSTNGNNIVVDNCYFNNCGTYNTISNDPTDRKAGIAITTSCNNIEVCNSTFNTIGLDAISVTGSTNAKIHNNTIITTYAAGVYISSSTYSDISNNVINGAGGNGVDGNTCDYLNVNNNTCYNCGGAGVMLANPDWCNIIGNVCLDNGQSSGSVHRGAITIHSTQNAMGVNISGNTAGVTSPTNELYGIYHLVTAGKVYNMFVDDTNVVPGHTEPTNTGWRNGGRITRELTAGTKMVICSSAESGKVDLYEVNGATFMNGIIRGARTTIVNGDSGWIGNGSTGTEKWLLYYDSTDSVIYLKNNQASTRKITINYQRYD